MIHSKLQMRKLYALEAKGDLPKGKADEMVHAEGKRRIANLPEKKARGGTVKYEVQANMPGVGGPSKAARCPTCGAPRYFAGGTVSPESSAKQFGREHAGAMGQAARTKDYHQSFRHYYETGEKGFAGGGLTPQKFDNRKYPPSFNSEAKGWAPAMALGGLTPEHFSSAQRGARLTPQHFSNRQAGPQLTPKHFTSRFAKGGLADTLSRGPQVRSFGRGDRLERQLAKGGEINMQSSTGLSNLLAKRRAARMGYGGIR